MTLKDRFDYILIREIPRAHLWILYVQILSSGFMHLRP